MLGGLLSGCQKVTTNKVKYMLKWFLGLVLVLTISVGFLILRPVPIPAEKDCLSFSGVVVNIYEGGVHDIVFRFRDNPKLYYINRGLERGLRLDSLSNLLQKEITIKYPKYWTPLDPGNASRHISKIEFEGRTIFSELKNSD